MTVNANLVVRSSCMLVGVGCEGKLRFVMKGIVSFICGAAIFSFQLVKLANFSIFAMVFRDFRREIYFAGVL